MTLIRRHWRVAGTAGIAALFLLIWGCSKQPGTGSSGAAQTAAESKPGNAAQSAMDEDLAPIVRTAWRGDLDGIVKRRVVRVLVPFRRPEFFYMDGHPAGILQEAFQELERVLNAKYKTTAANRIIVGLLPTPIDKLRERMAGGYGDIAAYSISITEENKQLVDFTVPTQTGLKMIVVTGPGAPELKATEDLSGKDIWITPQTRMKSDVEALNARLKSQGKAPAVMREADALLDPADIIEMVNAGTYPIALMQSRQAEFWAQVFDNVKPRMDLALAEDVETGWPIQKGTPQLKAFLDDFIKTHGVGTSFGNTLMRRYLKETKYVKNARDAAEMRKFRDTAPIFKKYAADYKFDYLLLAAQGYQESGLDQNVKSKVGAVGIMQVMPKTAASAPVKVANIQNAENNIHAGVRMIHFLVNDYFNQEGLDQLNRTLFAIAAYNAGPAKIAKCRQTAKDMGYDPDKWFGNVEVATAKLVGRETTQYVANIYKYYVAYRMASQIRDQKAARKAE
ncbi:MAG TPA: transglycosylase SLT domain-containing protein [Verrucomicrobiae bacterium]|nr:transglycosylase SLT domain-containing protein [Verrucomicrobiae bacterium]